MAEPENSKAGQDERQRLAALLPDLRAYARFLTGASSQADDLVQEALLRALAALSQFEQGTSLKAWVFTIQRNVFYEQARRRKREAAALRDEQLRPADLHPPATAMSDLSRALFALSPTLREALVLVGAEGLTHEEAALICGVPPGTMRARVSRARAQLAQSIEAPTPASA